VDIVGEAEGVHPFGYIVGCDYPVFIRDRERSGDVQNYVARPGDRVNVYIEKFQPGCVVASFVGNEGCFIYEGDETSVFLNTSNPRDIREALSIPNKGGGICGIFTIVKSARYDPRMDDKICRVRIDSVKTGKDRKYFVLAHPLDEKSIRKLDREIYYAVWPPQGIFADDVAELTQNHLPFQDTLARYIYGVPEQNKDVLFFTKDDRKITIDSGGLKTNMTATPHISETIENFARIYGGNRFRLIAVSPDKCGILKTAISDFCTDFTFEELPPRRSLPRNDS
jgi:hypothetical protein